MDPLQSTSLPPNAPQQRQVHPHMQDTQRAAINNALALLSQGDQTDMANIELFSPPPSKVHTRNVNEGFTKSNDPNVYVNGNSPLYHDAQNNDTNALKKLASVLVHEQHHIAHGPDEPPAYDAQVAILRQLGAPDGMIRDVEKGKQFAIRQSELMNEARQK